MLDDLLFGVCTTLRSRVQSISGEHLVDLMESVAAAQAAHQVVIQDELLALVHRAAAPPGFGRPEGRRLGNAMDLPHLEDAAMTFECGRMLQAGWDVVFVDVNASAH